MKGPMRILLVGVTVALMAVAARSEAVTGKAAQPSLVTDEKVANEPPKTEIEANIQNMSVCLQRCFCDRCPCVRWRQMLNAEYLNFQKRSGVGGTGDVNGGASTEGFYLMDCIICKAAHC